MTGTDTGDTGGPDKILYLCSLVSHQKCANILPDNALTSIEFDPFPIDSAFDACWVPIAENPPPQKQKSYCVEDTSPENAAFKCKASCDSYNAYLAAKCADPDYDCSVSLAVDCIQNFAIDQDDYPHPAADFPDNWECANGEMLPEWDALAPLVPFKGVASMILDDGTSTGIKGLDGYLSYKIDFNSCVDYYYCPIEVTALETLRSRIEGSYIDASGGTSDYEIEQIGFRVTSRIQGIWNANTERINFFNVEPGGYGHEPFTGEFWGGLGSVDGSSMWFGSHPIEVHQIVGSLAFPYDDDNPLTLNFTFNLPFGTVFASATTVPE